MKNDPVLSMIGLCNKAGKIKSGAVAVEKAVKNGEAFLLIIANDASDNSKKELLNMCSYYSCETCFYGTKDDFGNILGKSERSALAIIDEGFKKSILKKLPPAGEEGF
ncbi:MAG: ribosomal L7Ae/L30e/S12e/Gadd45 family protein [Lachnospiraceae bacterium]|nr:ribosomal L7Ae/L30e/S12e/Gadd45 family protein [Lachnospiraceae bacterium]